VSTDGAQADAEVGRDLLAALAPGYGLQDFTLALG
jgi:hypothetical protein